MSIFACKSFKEYRMRMYLMVLSVFISFFFLSCGDDAVQPQLNDKERTLVNGNWKGVWRIDSYRQDGSFFAQNMRFGADKQGDMQSCGQKSSFSWSIIQDTTIGTKKYRGTYLQLFLKDVFPQQRMYKITKLTPDSLAFYDEKSFNISNYILMIHNFSGYQDIQITRTGIVGNTYGVFGLCDNSTGSKAEIPDYGFRFYCAPNPCLSATRIQFTCGVAAQVKITFDGGPATQKRVIFDAMLNAGDYSVDINPENWQEKNWAEGIGKITVTVTPTGQSPRTTFLYLGISERYAVPF
jgi:hypothetical protein